MLCMKRFAILFATFVLGFTGCSTTPEVGSTDSPATSAEVQSDFLAEHSLGGMDGRQIIDHLDRMPVADRPDDLMASVHDAQLVLTDAEQEVVVPLGEDGFYLSVAPYVHQTHECFYHSLTSCRGELANQDIDVLIIDKNGEVLVDEQVTTFDNGFAGFWLPREVEGTIAVTYDGHTGQSTFSTGEEGATCLTTLQIDE